MKLNERVGKIAAGVSVGAAIEAFVQRRSTTGEEIDPEEERRAELMAIVEVMFVMAAVDGEVSEEELGELNASVRALVDIDALERSVIVETVIYELSTRLERDGWRTRLREAAAQIRAPEVRSFAFQLAAGVAFVDDFVAHAEAAGIDALTKAFEMTEEESQFLLRMVHASLSGG